MINPKGRHKTTIIDSQVNFNFSLRLALKQKAKNIRQKSFRTTNYNNFSEHSNQQKPEKFISMFNKLTDKIKGQIKEQKKKNKDEQKDANLHVIIGSPLSIKLNIENQDQITNGFTKKKNLHNLTLSNQARFTKNNSFYSKIPNTKKFSLTNYSQKIRKGSNVSRYRTSLDIHQNMQKQKSTKKKSKKIKTQLTQKMYEEFYPIGYAKLNIQSQRYLKQFQNQKLQINQKQDDEEQPLKQIYSKIYQIRTNQQAIKNRLNKNMRKIYTSYKYHCEDRQKQKQKKFSSQKTIKPEMIITNSHVISTGRDQNNASIGPWLVQRV